MGGGSRAAPAEPGRVPPLLSHSLDIVPDDHPWNPMSRDQFRQLRRHDRLRDRGSREWRVTAAPFKMQGYDHIVIRSGDQVRQVNERWADEYELLSPEDAEPSDLPEVVEHQRLRAIQILGRAHLKRRPTRRVRRPARPPATATV